MIEIINTGVGYLSDALSLFRNLITKLATVLPWEAQLTYVVIIALISMYLAFLYLKKFTISPMSKIHWYIVLATLIFLLLYSYS